jgi:selenocysteine-specific elongation factor
VRLRLLPHLRRPLLHNTTVNFHTGATQALAKIRLLEKPELKPGEATWAQLSLSEAVAVVKGDRFIIRSSVDTMGGGEIIESQTRRYRRSRPDLVEGLRVKEKGTAEEVLLVILETRQPLDETELTSQGDLPAATVRTATESLIQQKKLIGIGQGKHRLLFTKSGWERLTKTVSSALEDYHQRFPTRLGMPKAELTSRLKMGAHHSVILRRLVDDGIITEESTAIRLPAHKIQLTHAQQAKIDSFLKSIEQTPYAPPSNLVPESDLLNLLIEQQRVVKVSHDVVFSTSAYNEMVARVVSHLKTSGKVTVAEVRDMFKTSRKYAMVLLEHLDGVKITRRVGDERVLY